MNFKKLESGRSMVEMLGVLAIIGVLSVGGIAGYSLGMRKHRANQIVDVASKYAVLGYNKCQQRILNGEISGEAYGNNEWNADMIAGCDGGGNNLKFEEAGVGAVPAGVDWFGEATVLTNTESGDDTVAVSIYLDDDKLCKAIGSVTGSSTANCYPYHPGIAVFFKQN